MIVPAVGPLDAKAVVIGEQPGEREKDEGFVGPAGRVLNGALEKVGWSRKDLWITNVIKDKGPPLEEFYNPKTGFTPLGEDWRDALHQELDELHEKRVLILLGNVALKAIHNHANIRRWEGSVQWSPRHDCYTIPIQHPATILRGNAQNAVTLTMFLRRAQSIAYGTWAPTPRANIIWPSYDDVLIFLDTIREKGLSGTHIAYDIETMGRGRDMYIVCLSLSCELQSMCIPFVAWTGRGREDYFSTKGETKVWEQVARILEDPRILKIAQNAVFDTLFTLAQLGIDLRTVHDTMIAQHNIFPGFPKDLGKITTMWTTQPYYKDDGKAFIYGGMASKQDQAFIYNCLDSSICDEVYPNMRKQLKKAGNWEPYVEQCRQIEPLTFMVQRGMRVNMQKMVDARKTKLTEAAELAERLAHIMGDVNINSPDQLCKYFYETKGVKPYKNLKTKQPTTDEKALKRLAVATTARKAFPEAGMVLRYRKLTKLANTYLVADKVDPDGRIRCSYNPVGTLYTRLSSGKTIWGSGMNLQNWPHELLEFLEPDPGYVYISPDLSQAENRIVAYQADCKEMMHAFETGQDVHSLSAEAIIRNWPDTPTPPPDPRDLAPIGSGEHTWRDWGKRCNHGLNYDLSANSFAIYYEIKRTIAQAIVKSYFKKYPEIRENYHAKVRYKLRTKRAITTLMGRTHFFFGELSDEIFKKGYNCDPQSTVGDIIMRCINRIYYDKEFHEAELLNQVHDSIGLQQPLTNGWLNVAHQIHRLQKVMTYTLTSEYGKKFTIPVDFALGWNMNKDDKNAGIELKSKDIPPNPGDLATLLKNKMEALPKCKESYPISSQHGRLTATNSNPLACS